MEIFILVALVLLNGALAMAEIALVSARRNRLLRLAEDGDAGAAMAVRLGDDPTQFLSTIQIGITAIGIMNGIVGEKVLVAPFASWLNGLGVQAKISGPAATFLVVSLVTYVSIVVGELVPKRIGQFRAEGAARIAARPIAMLARLSRPLVALLSFSTDTILRLLGKGELSSSSLTEEDIHDVLAEGSAAGVIEHHEHAMVRNVLRLEDRQLASLMTPRSEIVYLDLGQPLAENLERLVHSNHTRLPVCRSGFHDLLGVMTAKRLCRQLLRGGEVDLTADLLPCVYVPETLNGMKLLAEFKESGVQMVFVVDEYGEILGLVTLQDVLESLAGEFKPRSPEEGWAVQRADGSWLLDGLTPILELKDRLALKEVPEEGKAKYHTLSGMMMWLLGDLPRTGDTAQWEQWRFEVVDMDNNRVDKVLASRVEERPS